MTERRRPGRRQASLNDGIDFGAPRWREPEGPVDGRSTRERRFRNASAPEQAGSVDAADSVPGRADQHEPDERSPG